MADINQLEEVEISYPDPADPTLRGTIQLTISLTPAFLALSQEQIRSAAPTHQDFLAALASAAVSQSDLFPG